MQLDESVESPVRETAGQFLRQKREAFGYDLRDVADRLRIRYVYLVAIEEDRLDDLPGATYAVGFVRAYAELLDLDGPEIVNRFREETAELAKEARLVFPSPQSEGRVPSGAILLLSIVAAALVYGGWVFLSSKDRPIAELVPALPERFLALIGKSEPVAPEGIAPVLPVPMASEGPAEPSGSAASQPEMPPVTVAPVGPVTSEPVENPSIAVAPAPAEPQTAVTAPQPAQTESPDNAVGSETADGRIPASEPLPDTGRDIPTVAAGNIESVDQSPGEPPATVSAGSPDAAAPATAAEPETNAAAAPSEDAPEPAPARVDLTALPAPPAPPRIDSTTPREYGEENTDARVVLRAAAEVWVQVRDSGGNLLLTRLLRTGDSYRVPNDPGLVMRTGNAGGLDILVDGSAIPRIGSKGAVMKEVQLDADLLKAGTATRQ
ncbi:MAG: RodZ domain-containing protein [Alphaproteobacteria bacterium]